VRGAVLGNVGVALGEPRANLSGGVGPGAVVVLGLVTAAAVVASSTLSTTSLIPVLVSALVTLPVSGANLYEAQLRLQTTGTPNRATCKQAQLIVDWLQP